MAIVSTSLLLEITLTFGESNIVSEIESVHYGYVQGIISLGQFPISEFIKKEVYRD